MFIFLKEDSSLMKIGKLLTMAAALVLCAGVSMAARTTATTNSSKTNTTSSKMTTHHLTGTISSVTGSDLVVTHKYKGKDENSTFMLNSTTKKEGNLDKGAMAVVYYEVKNNQKIATEVKVNQTKKS